ncbi:glycoside hydrolase family 32 protein [Alkalihalobacterium chitinilyticum]|uniref:Sucrose-6-phosphate hydrolase n=1 Tax=Alkalihalobacterium chitinilyticum TaxID=2980103 RepID=A0ABT5VHX5_9BACI|nr:glycoside hydrolase family 32 protein [Alkalihalobacterium chitinilyticum]MDE5415055.1 glycoside hydrolase family 32 protein [Alkalihalobacterium chitinilyticum]
METNTNNHKEQIAKAMQSVITEHEKVNQDPWRLNYHVATPAFWMNDPNGFIYYKGEYHLFYQHHPYSPEWGPMFWGHVKSTDLMQWTHLPIALAPSEDYDADGCFSGSAIEKDGNLYLMYTGNVWTGENRDTDLKQVQCLAVSEDAIHFDKLKENPVILEAPEGNIHPYHFRDPKVWKHNDYYYCVLGSKTNEETGQILLYRSRDLFSWKFMAVSAKGEGNFGYMWECPDIFTLEEQEVLVMSPQGLTPEGDKYHNLHQAGYVLGKLNYDTGVLQHGEFEMLDYGFDFYAPQTTIDDQGRRIMIAWMAMWESEMPEQNQNWAGAMTLPRQLILENGKIKSKPIPEIENIRGNQVIYENLIVEGEVAFKEVDGNSLELDVYINANEASQFGLKLRMNETGEQYTELKYDVNSGVMTFDRNQAGSGPGGVRKAPVQLINNTLHLRIFIDKSSVEVFINDGEKVMTGRIYPDENSTSIRFFSDGPCQLTHLKKWDLKHSITYMEKK